LIKASVTTTSPDTRYIPLGCYGFPMEIAKTKMEGVPMAAYLGTEWGCLQMEFVGPKAAASSSGILEGKTRSNGRNAFSRGARLWAGSPLHQDGKRVVLLIRICGGYLHNPRIRIGEIPLSLPAIANVMDA
jgi:hypothetical protein